MPELILASSSAWRRQILAEVGLAARSVPPGVDEDPGGVEDPVELAIALALRKARAVSARHPAAWVLGADQVVSDPERPGAIWGKPEGPRDHLEQLLRLRGRAHVLTTGWALLAPGAERTGHCSTTLHVRADLEEGELRAYVRSGEGSGCAGGYRAEGRGAFLFERIEGDWFNVLGLPILDVFGALRELGWRFGGEG